MGEVSDSIGRRRRSARLLGAFGAAVVALTTAGCDRQGVVAGNGPQGDLGRYAAGAMKNLIASPLGSVEPDVAFKDATGKALDLKRFKGKLVVVNLWATWCGPCVTEMPTLATLQKRYEDKGVVVVPISVDRPSNIEDAKSFIGVHPPLPLYSDPDWGIATKLQLHVLPATIIYDREGHEVARVRGEANWDSPEAKALIDHLLKAG